MSRIGKLPIVIPAGVTVTISGNEVKVKGPKGEPYKGKGIKFVGEVIRRKSGKSAGAK